MTALCEVIFWIASVFVFVSSTHSVFRGDNNNICHANVSINRSRNVSFTETYKASTKSWCWLNCWETQTRTAYRLEYDKVWSLKQTCCTDYEYRNGTCRAKCPPTCTNGECEQPNICKCNYGLNGNFCNESLVCYVRINSTGTMSDSDLLGNVSIVNVTADIDPIIPACQSKCRDQITNTTVNTTQSKDGLFYFIPFDSPCNLNSAADSVPWKEYSILIGAVIGTTLLVVVACAVCILRQKRKITKEKTSNEPPQLALSNYMEENEIYS